MHARQISAPFDLSFQDKYILTFEREDLPYNSHLVIETVNELNTEKLIRTFEKLIVVEPFCRIIPVVNTGKFRILDSWDIKAQIFTLKEDELEKFWNRKYKFPD